MKHDERVIVIDVCWSLAEKNLDTEVAKWSKSNGENAPMRNGKTMVRFKFLKS